MSATKKILGGVLIIALTGGAIAGFFAVSRLYNEGKIDIPFINNSSEDNVQIIGTSSSDPTSSNNANVNIDTVIRASGINVRKVSEGVNGQGQATKTFSYEVSPSNATNQEVSATINWSNSSVSSQISNYLSATINANNKTITVTAKQDFAYQATLTVESVENSSKYATVTIDCVEKHLGWKSTINAPYYCPQYTFFNGHYRSGWGHSNDYVSYSTSSATSGPWSVSSFDLGNSTIYSKSASITKDMEIVVPDINAKRSCKLVVFGVNGQYGHYYEGEEIDDNSILNSDNKYIAEFGMESTLPDIVDIDELDNIRSAISTKLADKISSLGSATKSELTRLKNASNADYYYYFGLKFPIQITCYSSTAGTATYDRPCYVMESISSFTF